MNIVTGNIVYSKEVSADLLGVDKTKPSKILFNTLICVRVQLNVAKFEIAKVSP